MVETGRLADVGAYNERSLKALDRAIALSRGEFSLVLVRCNYQHLQQRVLHELRELARDRYEFRDIELPSSSITLYTTLQTYGRGKHCLNNKPHPALIILGLESVVDLDDLLTSTNQVRDEFRKRMPFPLVLWVNDEVLQKLLQFAPDFTSWAATPIKFEIATPELIDFLRNKADALFKTVLSGGSGKYAPWRVCAHHSTLNLATGCRNRLELDAAVRDLQRRGEAIDPQLEASLQFIFGQYDHASDEIDSAIARYQESLRFWRASNDLERQGVLLFYIGLCYCRKADLHRGQRSLRHWEEAWPYLQQCMEVFIEAGRKDLVAVFITQLAEVLQRLKAWDSLLPIAQKSLTLHQAYGSGVQLAQDYGFLAEVALEQSRWAEAKEYAKQALTLLAEFSGTPDEHQGLHRFLLAQLYLLFLVKSYRQLGELSEATKHLETASLGLEKAIESSVHRYEPERYLHLLEGMRSLYFEQGCYLEAFKIKQEQRAVEQLYGFRAFIGAGRLQPQRSLANTTQQEIVQEIAASGRQRDVNRLIERISRADRKLTVIHGLSGVGKSSIISAGLVPALKHGVLGDRIVLPIVLQVYTDWVRDLGKLVGKALRECGSQDGEALTPFHFNKIQSDRQKIQKLLEQLKQNAERNLLTVLIFDQFEEFFFAASDRAEKIKFYQFLKDCLDLPFVKVIFSLREDYLHFLLELERFHLEIIDDNILDKQIRYPLGNLTIEDAHSVIQQLTERAHFYLERALIDELVQDLAGEQGEVLPIELQVVGAQLQSENITTLAQYKERGPKKRLVERFVEKVITDCGLENEHTAWRVLSLLTDENNNRPLKTRAELAVESNIESEKLDLILEILEKSGLVFLLPEVPANRYQLIHDYLVDFIRQKEQTNIREELEELRKKDQQSRDEIEQLRAELREKKLRQRLAEATEKQRKTEDKLNQVLAQSLRKSRWVGVGLATLTVIAAGLWQWALFKETDARLNALSADSEALVASYREFDALLKSIEAGRKLKKSIGVQPETRMRVVTALQQLVYRLKERNRLEGHAGRVRSVSFSPDGTTIASAGEDKIVKLWKADGSFVKNLEGHTEIVNSVRFSRDGQLIASASNDKTVKLWNSDGDLLGTLTGHRERVHSVSFSPDGQIVASASEDKTVKLWRTKDGVLLGTLRHANWVLGVSFSPDGQFIASAGADKTIKLWKRDGRLFKAWEAHAQPVVSVSFSPDSQIIASASEDKTVKFWNLQGKEVRPALKGHDNAVISVSFSSDGKRIATASFDKTVKLWNADNGKLIDTLRGHGKDVFDVSFSPKGDLIASASADNTVRLWSSQGSMLRPIQAHKQAIFGVSYSPDGKTIATASEDNTIKLWSDQGKLLETISAHSQPVNGVSFSPDGDLIATASDDETVKLWKPDGTLIRTLRGHEAAVVSVSFSPDSDLIATASDDRTVKLWKPDGTLVRTLCGHKGAILSVSFSPDGDLIATASEDKTVKLWKGDGTFVRTLKEYNAPVNWVSFSPDGKAIATAGEDGTVSLWSRDGKSLKSLKRDSVAVNWVSFSRDGNIIAAASEDSTVKLWSADGDFIKSLEGHKATVFGVSFSPDGKQLGSVSKDGTMILWDLDLDNLLKRGCGWLHDYLHNPERQSINLASPKDSRALCDGRRF